MHSQIAPSVLCSLFSLALDKVKGTISIPIFVLEAGIVASNSSMATRGSEAALTDSPEANGHNATKP